MGFNDAVSPCDVCKGRGIDCDCCGCCRDVDDRKRCKEKGIICLEEME